MVQLFGAVLSDTELRLHVNYILISIHQMNIAKFGMENGERKKHWLRWRQNRTKQTSMTHKMARKQCNLLKIMKIKKANYDWMWSCLNAIDLKLVSLLAERRLKANNGFDSIEGGGSSNGWCVQLICTWTNKSVHELRYARRWRMRMCVCVWRV